MGIRKHIRQVAPGRFRGEFLVGEYAAEIHLNPAESTLYRLFLAHPEGIASDDLLLYWEELISLYGQESVFDESLRQEDALVSLCAESKIVFYSNISRIKCKFVKALGARHAAGYYIKRYADGLYRTRAVLITENDQ